MKRKNWIHLIVGPVLFAVCTLWIPHTVFKTTASRAAIGTVLWMAYWWVTAPVDYAVTALLPIALNAVFQMTGMASVIANYASETIILLLGASILTVTWEKTGLDKRIAARFLSLLGSSYRNQLILWFLLSTLLSTVLPNAVVCATVTPIAVSMLKYVGEDDIDKSPRASKILLYVAYGAGVGGLATPLGGAMNLVTVDYIQQVTGREFMYTSWVIRFLPIMIVLVICNILFMLRDTKKGDVMGNSREFFLKEYRAMPKMSLEEKWALGLFAAATVLSFTRQLYQDLLPGLKPAYSFIICAIISFLICKNDGQRLLKWRSVQTRILWEMIYIFAGGLALGTLVNGSGAATEIGSYMSGMNLDGGLVTVFVIIFVTILMSDVTSNTATAAVAMPIVISVIQGIGRNPIPYIYIASIGVNLSYMLPTSIRAIPVGYGLKPRYMLKEGWKLTLIVLVLMTLTAYLCLKYWNLFSLT